MRNLLALLAAFTLSTSTAITAVACGTANQTTVVIFDWNGVINGQHNETTERMYQFLLDNTDTGIGQTLYKDIVDYTSLSILKTNSTFAEDYQFAKQSVENQIKNIQDSLRAKYGRSWETQWKNFLKEPAQGGDGKTGSYQRYFDILLKGKANAIVSQYYVGDNYHDYQYYNSTEIIIWLTDIFDKIKKDKWTLDQYRNSGTYKDRVWIVANSYYQDPASFPPQPNYQELATAIDNANNISDIKLSYKVAQTKNGEAATNNDEDYLVDPSATIKGLLSDQQTKIAQVWMKNQGPIWTRQIVVPFKDGESKNNALRDTIKADDFPTEQLNQVLTKINNSAFGFEATLKNEQENINSSTSSATSGDLGLITLNSDTANIKPSFSYYLYRYVTSAQGIGEQGDTTTTSLYNIPEYTGAGGSDRIEKLIEQINRTTYTGAKDNHSSNYNDLVWMKDADENNQYNGAGIAVFIDADGIHFVQTPGITYSSTIATEPVQKIITDYTQLLANPDKRKNATWDDVKNLADRPGGLTNNPYLDFLQTQYLLWVTKNSKTYFDLNDHLSKFTSGSNDISSDIWWDYILYFNNNIDNINWNLPTLLNSDVEAPSDRIYSFITSMKTWFQTTFQTRWNLHQGIISTDNLIKSMSDLNTTWDGKDYMNGPVARLEPADIRSYIKNIAAQTIWWYDSNSIQS